MNALRLPLAALALASLTTACAAERPIEAWDDGTFQQYPDDAIAVGDMWVRSATLEGTIAQDTFAGQARVTNDDDGYGNQALELALPTERGAVMHLLAFDSGVLEQLEPGDTLSYSGNSDVGMEPRVCSGQRLDAWELDMAVEQVELTVADGPEQGTRIVEWTVVNRTEDLFSDETSTGQLVLADTPF